MQVGHMFTAFHLSVTDTRRAHVTQAGIGGLRHKPRHNNGRGNFCWGEDAPPNLGMARDCRPATTERVLPRMSCLEFENRSGVWGQTAPMRGVGSAHGLAVGVGSVA